MFCKIIFSSKLDLLKATCFYYTKTSAAILRPMQLNCSPFKVLKTYHYKTDYMPFFIVAHKNMR